MSESTLFGDRFPPACEYCEFAFASGRKDFRVCCKKGLVPTVFSCRHYRYDPLLRVPRLPMELGKFEPEDFTL